MVSILLFCESRYPVNRHTIRKTVEAVLGEHGVSSNAQVSLAIVGDRKMRALNKKYRGEDKTTDVLSFSQDIASPDGILRLGDIVVSFPQARENAIKKEVLVDEEINFLVRHTLLNLLGIQQ